MNVQETLDILYQLCKEDAVLRRRLLTTRQSANPAAEFCKISTEIGYPISAIDLVMAGEEAYAEMARSTNGGGENHPRIQNADDLYELFLGSIEV
ncbi:MAG: hypothetical protein IJQ27_03110 [Spirochaetia bacterium]|nr:hypothetical protein [Spirochaetia bacterium]